MAYVYRHIRLDKNQPFYIGIGENGRAYSSRGRNDNWHNIVNITDYDVEILMDGLSRDEAFEKEREFIALYGRSDNETGFLCNRTNGGCGQSGVKVSEETRKKMGKAQLGNKKYLLRTTSQDEINKKISSANKGRIMSEEQKGKIKNNFIINGHPCLGKKASNETKNKIAASRRRSVLQFDLDDNLIREWDSILSAKKEGYCNVAIWRCINGTYKHHKKSIWKYKN
jgi:hypothetical protein